MKSKSANKVTIPLSSQVTSQNNPELVFLIRGDTHYVVINLIFEIFINIIKLE